MKHFLVYLNCSQTNLVDRPTQMFYIWISVCWYLNDTTGQPAHMQTHLRYVDVCFVSEADLIVGGIVGVVHLSNWWSQRLHIQFSYYCGLPVCLHKTQPGRPPRPGAGGNVFILHYHQDQEQHQHHHHHHYQQIAILVFCYAPPLS